MNKKIIGLVLTGVLSIGLLTGCTESFNRELKSAQSEYGGGLNRTITLYDYNGKEIKSWTGKFDVDASTDGNKVKFDINGKRVIINGGIVVNEEK